MVHAELIINESLSDEDLFSIIGLKDYDLKRAQQAYCIFFNRYNRLLWTLCHDVCSHWGLANSDTIAQEIFSETLLAIYKHPTYDISKGKVSTWISKIAQSKAYNILNQGTPKESYLEDMGPIESFIDEENEEIITPKKKLLTEALNMLSEVERDILMTYYRYHSDQKHLPDHVLKELCDHHKKTSTNIRQIKKRALDKVKNHIRQSS